MTAEKLNANPLFLLLNDKTMAEKTKRKMNPNSLKNLQDIRDVNKRRTKEEIKERCSKAGKISGQKRRDTRTLKEIALQLMAETATPEDIERYGLPEGSSNALVMTAAAARKAREGDLKAYEILRDTAGQMPTKEVSLSAEVITEADKKLLEKVSKRLKEDI